MIIYLCIITTLCFLILCYIAYINLCKIINQQEIYDLLIKNIKEIKDLLNKIYKK